MVLRAPTLLPDPHPSVTPRRKAFSVSVVVRRADQVIREKAPPLWVRGEVSGWKQYPSGHCYFTLKDDAAELSCALWASAARLLPALPENGMLIEVFGQLGIYPRRGQFQLEVARLETTDAGGLWQLALERLTAKLRREGLLDEERKRSLPQHPERVGIATSSQSAALHDMLRSLRRKAWWMTSLVSHCSVEGVHAAPEIAAAIRRFGNSRGACAVDVVIVARGGGSLESLWAYNTEEVARAIAACPVPVISAVGHETDYTIADLVADVRAATPTAGAELAVPDGRQILGQLDEFRRESRARLLRSQRRQAEVLGRLQDELGRSVGQRLALLETGVHAASRHLEARSPRQRLRQADGELHRLCGDLHVTMGRRLAALGREVEDRHDALHASAGLRQQALEHALGSLAEALEARSPLRVLARGYARLQDAEGRQVIRSVEEVRPAQRLRVRLVDGEFTARVEAAPTGAVEALTPPHA